MEGFDLKKPAKSRNELDPLNDLVEQFFSRNHKLHIIMHGQWILNSQKNDTSLENDLAESNVSIDRHRRLAFATQAV